MEAAPLQHPLVIEEEQMEVSPGQVLQTEQSESPEAPREFVMSDSHEMLQPAMTRRDSLGSVKSLRSYRSVRESLGKMHAYVDMVTKLDSKKHS